MLTNMLRVLLPTSMLITEKELTQPAIQPPQTVTPSKRILASLRACACQNHLATQPGHEINNQSQASANFFRLDHSFAEHLFGCRVSEPLVDVPLGGIGAQFYGLAGSTSSVTSRDRFAWLRGRIFNWRETGLNMYHFDNSPCRRHNKVSSYPGLHIVVQGGKVFMQLSLTPKNELRVARPIYTTRVPEW